MRVYSIVFAHTGFLALQKHLWEKFCPQMTEFIAVNNGPNYDELEAQIKALGITTIRCPDFLPLDVALKQTEGYSCGSHAHALNYLIQQESPKYPNEALFFVDFDLFPIRPFADVAAGIAGPTQVRPLGPNGADIAYPWGGMLYLGANIPERETIRANRIGSDTGGGVSLYIAAHPEVEVAWWPERHLQQQDIPDTLDLEKARSFDFHVMRDSCLHFFRGSNWFGYPQEWFKEKVIFFFKWMETLDG